MTLPIIKPAATVFVSGAMLAAPSTAAHAHLGHVGELAGHSHWIGIGAVAAAGVLAYLVGKKLRKDNATSEDGSEDTAETDADNEPASA